MGTSTPFPIDNIDVTEQMPTATVNAADLVLIYDASEARWKAITVANLKASAGWVA